MAKHISLVVLAVGDRFVPRVVVAASEPALFARCNRQVEGLDRLLLENVVVEQTGGVHGDLCACTDSAACTQTFKNVLDSLSKTITSAAKPLDCEYPHCPKSCEKIKATTSGRVSVAFGCVRKPVNVPK